MLITFRIAALTFLVVTAAEASFAAPAAMNAGLGGPAAMMESPRPLPQFGPHSDHGFFDGDHDFDRDRDFDGDQDFHRDHDFHRDFHRDHHFRRGSVVFWGWPWGWWPIYEEHSYRYSPASAASYPPPPMEVSQPPSPPPCPELVHWDPKLGHATRQKLCDEVAH